jgi:16S rRNA (cytidine1402-2'-O)-methyltransferase
VALVTDAGTPGISDPGALLVAAAWEAGHRVVPVPGPSAVAAALSVAGFPADQYHFMGFLPRKSADRREAVRRATGLGVTVVAYETPHRLARSLRDVAAVLGDRPMVVCRELTKIHEEVWRGSAVEAASKWAETPPRGEITLVFAAGEPETAEPWDDDRARAALDALRAAGLGPKQASRQVAAQAGRPARELYALWDHEAS